MSRVVTAVVVLACSICSAASAQVIYEPVRYQYGHGANIYYYGGSDPRTHVWAQEPVGGAGRWGRADGWAFVSGDLIHHREVANEPTRTFTDALGARNATFFGFTPDDARNEAYAAVPRYFVKRDLLNAAIRTPVGWVVPAQAQPVEVDRPIVRRTVPATEPRPLMVIPKDALPQPAPSSDRLLVVASSS